MVTYSAPARARKRQRKMHEYEAELRGAIEHVRQNMGAPDCVTCSRRFKAFMDALLVALEVGAEAMDADERGIFFNDFCHIIKTEAKRGHAH